MNNKDFDDSINSTQELVAKMLISKGKEYASDSDRLHNFNVAAEFNGSKRETALWGMATKHFVSISDMIRETEKGSLFEHSEEKWTEKIMDAINYLYILRAIRLDNQLQLKECKVESVPEPRER